MKIIDITKNIKDKNYLFFYEFKLDTSDNNQIIGNSSIRKYELDNTYLMEVNIFELKHKNNYKYIIFNTLLKYINTYNKQKNKLIIILDKTNYFEIFIIVAQNFKLIEQTDSQNIYEFDTNEALQIRKSNQRHSISNFTIPSLIKYDKSYIISAAKTEGLVYITLINYLNKLGLQEITNNMNKPFLLWIEILENYKFDPQYFYTNCYIMNILDDKNKSIITNKFNLYFTLKKYFPNECQKYMAESWDFRSFINSTNLKSRIINKKEVFIIRPAGNGAFSGKDIYIVNNDETLKEAINKTQKYDNLLITKYITNPLLFENKKFHIRIYFLVGLIQGHFMTKALEFYKILTAGKPYKNKDFYNKEIHDTHAKSTNRDITFPIDIYDSRLYNDFTYKYFPKIKDCLLTISKFINGKLTKYSQSENAFEVFGCDFLIKDNEEIVLMEINDKVGYAFKSTENSAFIKFSKIYFENIINLILEPILKEQKISENKANWLFFN